MATNQQQSRPDSVNFSIFPFVSPHLSGMITVSHNAHQREADCSCAACGKGGAITRGPPTVSSGSTGEESGELLIPCTIGHLNPDRHHIYTELKLSPSLMTEPAEGSPLASQPAIHNS